MANDVKLETIKTPKALGCYVTLAKPRAMEVGKEPEYSIALLWPKTTNLDAIKKAILIAAQSKWGPNAGALLGTKLRNPLRDGDVKAVENGNGKADPADPYCGKLFVNARSKQRVTIVDTTLQAVDPVEVYSGCYFHAQLRFYPYDAKGNKGVGCGLQNLMLVNKGKRIDGRESADKAFREFTPDTTPVEGEEDALDVLG